MKRVFSLFVIFFVFVFSVVAQTRNPSLGINQANVWQFGASSGLGPKDAPSIHWNTGVPIVMNDGNGGEVTSVCDSLGNQQIAGGAFKIYNRLHNVIQNGGGVIGDSGWINILQNSMAVPKPKDPNTIYFFTSSVTVKYCTIDMQLDGGNGGITVRNKELHPYPTGIKLAGVHHCNGTDVWVVGHEWQNDKFFAYLVTQDGIDTTPVISAVGPLDNDNPTWQGGSIKFSPNGKRLAFATPGKVTPSYVFDFDNSTGVITSPIVLKKDTGDWGTSFSPDNSKLYIGTNNGRLLQYNLDAGNAIAVAASRAVIYDNEIYQTAYAFGHMQIGPNGKIYVTKKGWPGSDYMGVIENPNALDTFCNFNPVSINLTGGFGATFGPINTLESYYYTGTSAYPCYEDTIVNNLSDIVTEVDMHASPNPFSDYTLIELSGDAITNEKINFKLFDGLGQEYENHITETYFTEKKANVVFRRGNLSVGVYFLKVYSSSNNIGTIKLSLV